jgi:hypothetical protein
VPGSYGPSVAKPAANPGIKVRSQVREATFHPRVAPIISNCNKNNSYKVQFLFNQVVRKSNKKFNVNYLALNKKMEIKQGWG